MACFRKILAILLLPFFFACSGKPVASDGGDLTRVEVEYISRSLAAAVERRFPLLKHKFVNRYVDSIGQQIISRNPEMPPLPYEFRILKSEEANIFSLPGGIIYVTLGMLRQTDAEGQVIAALAHELAHQQLGHSLQVWRTRINSNRGQKLPLPEQLSWEQNFLGEYGFLRMPEGMEKEADQLLPLLLYRAGYDPRLANAFFLWLQKTEQKNPAMIASMRAVHPATAERISWSKESILRIPPARDARSSSGPAYLELKQLLADVQKKARVRDDKSE